MPGGQAGMGRHLREAHPHVPRVVSRTLASLEVMLAKADNAGAPGPILCFGDSITAGFHGRSVSSRASEQGMCGRYGADLPMCEKNASTPASVSRVELEQHAWTNESSLLVVGVRFSGVVCPHAGYPLN